MSAAQVICLVLGLVASSSNVVGQCPFADKSVSPAIAAAIADAGDISPVNDIPQKLFIGDHLLKNKRSVPENTELQQKRVRRGETIPYSSVQTIFGQCLKEVEKESYSLEPLYQKGGPAQSYRNSSSFDHYRNFRTHHDSLDLNTYAAALIRTTERLQKEYAGRYGMTSHGFIDYLQHHGYIIKDLYRKCTPIPHCTKATLYYRTMDGSCNNLYHPTWGMSKTPLVRIVPPSYSDGIYALKVSKSGNELPSASLVSLVLFKDAHRPDPIWTRSVMLWGQFVAHDMSLSPSTQSKKGPITCCTADNSRPLPKSQLHPACLPIEVPPFHPFYSKYGVRCLNFVRSITVPSEGCKLGYAEQGNVVTSYLDLSTVYGSSDEVAKRLRTFKGGRLIAHYSKEAGGEIPPPARNKMDACNVNSDSEPCYEAGDIRVNLHLDLTVLQTMFLRWHNELCRQLEYLNPHWSDEKLYQEARKIAIAGYQHIHYTEWLPILLGYKVMYKYGLLSKYEDEYGYVRDYDPEIPAGVINGHTTGAARHLHSLCVGAVELLTPDRKVFDVKYLSDNFNKPAPLEEKYVFDGLVTGMITQSMQSNDHYYTEQITRYLFKNKKNYGFDLESIDVQRHRDHGLGSYNTYRYLCGLPKAHEWEDFLDVMTPDSMQKLRSLYEHPDDVELIAGVTLEKTIKGSLMGPTGVCIMTEQFYRTRRGDRFFYQNGEKPGGFTPAQLAEIKKYTWARLVCDTTGVNKVQPEAFRVVSKDNPLVDCRSIPYINLEAWKESPEYH